MLPDYLNSFDPLKQRLTGKDSSADQQKVRTALKQILGGKAGGPEFGMVSGSAEEKALGMVGGNTGRFAGNYVIKNYDKLDPMVRELVGTKTNPLQASMYGDEIEGSVEKGQQVLSSLPSSVRTAISNQAKKEMRIKKSKSKRPSFLSTDMENVGLQEGGMVPVDGEGNVPPQAVAGDVVNGAPMGMVDVPNGGGPVDDGVPTELPEGTVVINAAAIRLHGTETIDNLINAAVDELLSEGVQISMEDPNPEDDVPVAISNGEYVIPPEVAEKIGYKKLEDMNERGRAYLQKQQAQEKQQAAAQQQPSQPSQQPPESFMGAPMPPEQAGPPQAPVQSEQQAMAMMGMMDGGRVPLENGGNLARAKNSFINWFSSTYLGDKMDPAESSFDKMLGKRSASYTEPNPQYKIKPGTIGVPVFPRDYVRVSEEKLLLEQQQQREAKKANILPQRNANGGEIKFPQKKEKPILPETTSNVPDGFKFKDKNMGVFAKDIVGNMLQGENESDEAFAQRVQAQIDTASALLEQGLEESKGRTKSIISAIEKPKPNRGAFFEAGVDPLYDATLAELGPTTQFTPNVQRAAEGGFIGEYNYAQPQQATMGTPFPNAVDSSPQQSRSFLRPNDAKKNSRVELATGRTVLEQMKKGKDLKLAAPPPSMLDPTGGIPPKDSSFEKTEGPRTPRTPRAKPKPVESISYVTRMLMGEAGGQSLEEQKFVLDTLKNRIISDQSQLNKSVATRDAFEKAYQTFEKHYLDDRGDLRRRGTGRLQATAQQIKDKEDFVREYLAQPPSSEATHMMKKGYDFSGVRRPQDMHLLLGLDTNFEHDFYVEDPDRPPPPRKKPTPPPRKNKATGGFINLQEGGKVSNRFKLFEPKNLTGKALQGYQDLEDRLFRFADEVRKFSFGLQLEDAYPENSQSRKNIEDDFAFIIDDMADQVIRGQAYINTNDYTKFIPENSDESVYGGASDLRGVSKLEKYRKQELVDYLHKMYQSRVYDVVNSGLTEEEVMASSSKSIQESKDSVPGDRHIDAGHALEYRARKKYEGAKDPFLVDPSKTKPKAKPMPNPSRTSIATKPNFLNI